MRLRGEVAERLFSEFIAVLSARNASYLTPQTPRKLAKHAGPDRLFTMTEVRHLFSSPAGALAAFNATSPSNPGVGTLAATQPCPPTKPFAALAPAPWSLPQPAAGHLTVAAFQNQTATAPGQHGVPFEHPQAAKKPRRAVPLPAERTGAPSTAPSATVARPPATAARGDILDYLRTQKVCFAHAFSGNCRRRSSCLWQHEPFPAALYKDVASTRRPGSDAPRRRLAAMTETQYNTAAVLGLILEDATDEAEEAGREDSSEALESFDPHELSQEPHNEILS